MMEIVNPIYRDEKAEVLNKMIVELINDLELTKEGLIEEVMDITLDHIAQREKTYSELMENPDDFHKVISINEKCTFVDEIIEGLKSIVYVGYKSTPFKHEQHKDPRVRLNVDAQRLWVASYVKPLILEDGITSQKIISEKVCTPANTISQRVTKSYGVSWDEYVSLVQQGTF